jgi:hypothetical protein
VVNPAHPIPHGIYQRHQKTKQKRNSAQYIHTAQSRSQSPGPNYKCLVFSSQTLSHQIVLAHSAYICQKVGGTARGMVKFIVGIKLQTACTSNQSASLLLQPLASNTQNRQFWKSNLTQICRNADFKIIQSTK